MKLQTKIALLFASLTGGILITMSVFLYYLINQNSFEDYYKRLEIRAIVAAKSALGKKGEAYSDIREQHLEKLPGEREIIIPVYGKIDQKVIDALPGLPEYVLDQARREGKALWRRNDVFYYLLDYREGFREYFVMISARNDISNEYLSYFRRALVICLVAAAVLAFTVGLFFSKGILRPIRNVASQMRRLGVSNLHLRLDPVPGNDEIAELTETFNGMLDRLETSFESQNNFVSHASHEFNTPLTAIIGEAEFALARPRDMEQYVSSIATMQHAAERLSGITRSLLQLAQTGLTGKSLEITLVRMDELLLKSKRMTSDIIQDSQVVINSSLAPEDMDRVVVSGNQTLLELALTNIVLNASKYSSNQPVQLALAATNDKAIIVVKDRGIGIPADELKYIFDPFFRARNTDRYKGYGIGLPLTRNIVRMHKGELIVNSEEGQGTEIQIVLPLMVRTEPKPV